MLKIEIQVHPIVSEPGRKLTRFVITIRFIANVSNVDFSSNPAVTGIPMRSGGNILGAPQPEPRTQGVGITIYNNPPNLLTPAKQIRDNTHMCVYARVCERAIRIYPGLNKQAMRFVCTHTKCNTWKW